MDRNGIIVTGKIKIITISDAVRLAEKGAELMHNAAGEAVARKDSFAVAVSGGSTPRAMHRLLSQEPYLSDMPWQKTHFFWVDERMVPFDHPDSNYGAAQKDLMSMIPIPADQVYPMPAMMRPEEGADLYQAKLKTFFQDLGSLDPVFDLIILGIGTDGHTASLFPGQPSNQEPDRWVLGVKGGQPDVFRLTLTYAVLNSARHILFLVSGDAKAAVVKTLIEDRHAQLPAAKIQPLNGKMTWLLDQKAASLLNAETIAFFSVDGFVKK
jgi:6-phosphogluconolactonase